MAMNNEQNRIHLDLTPSDVEQILWQLQIAANETGAISTVDWFVDKCSKSGMVFYRDGNGTMRAKLPPPKTKWDKPKLNRLNILKKREKLAEAMGDTESAEFYKKLRLVEMIEFNVRERASKTMIRYDKMFTRLLKGKPSEDECIKTALGGVVGSFTKIESMLKGNHEKTT